MRISNGKQTYINLEDKEYNKLLDRLDNALMEKELLNDDLKAEQLSNLEKVKEIKELKNSLKKGHERCNDYNELVNDQAEEINAKRVEISTLIDRVQELKKHNIYYSSQVKAIKRIAEQPQSSCDNTTRLNNIIDICFDTGIDFDYEKELKKDVEFYRSKVKVLLNDMLEYGRNDIKKVDINNMVTEIMRATLSYDQEINMNDKDKKELITSLKCIINNNINLGNKGGKNA